MRSRINKLVTKIGYRFGIDSHYFVKNTIWLLVGQGMISFAAFVSTVVLANNVEKNSLGDYRLVVSVYNTLTFFALSGATSALIRSVAQGKEGTLLYAVGLKKKYGVLAFIVGLGVAVYFWYLKHNPMLGICFLIMAACLPLIETYAMYVPYLQGKHEFKYSSIHTGIAKLFTAIVLVAITYYHPTTIYLVAGFYMSQVFITYLQYKHLVKQFPAKSNDVDQEMHPYARHVTVASFLGLLLSQADKIILYHFFGPIALAQYWIASSIPQEVGRVIGAAAQVIFPKLATNEYARDKNSFIKKLKIFMWIMILFSSGYALIAYPLFTVFFPKYVDQAAMSIVLMFAAAVVPNWFVWQYYMAKGNIKIVYLANIMEPVLQVCLYVSLIPFFGIWGLVIAALTRSVVMNLASFYIIRRV